MRERILWEKTFNNDLKGVGFAKSSGNISSPLKVSGWRKHDNIAPWFRSSAMLQCRQGQHQGQRMAMLQIEVDLLPENWSKFLYTVLGKSFWKSRPRVLVSIWAIPSKTADTTWQRLRSYSLDAIEHHVMIDGFWCYSDCRNSSSQTPVCVRIRQCRYTPSSVPICGRNIISYATDFECVWLFVMIRGNADELSIQPYLMLTAAPIVCFSHRLGTKIPSVSRHLHNWKSANMAAFILGSWKISDNMLRRLGDFGKTCAERHQVQGFRTWWWDGLGQRNSEMKKIAWRLVVQFWHSHSKIGPIWMAFWNR